MEVNKETRFIETTMKPLGDDYEIDFNDKKALVRDFEVIDPSGKIGREIGMSYQSLADLLDYSSINNARNLVRRSRDEFEDDLFNPNEIKVIRNGLPQKTYSQAIYVVGAGLDLFLMKSRQPLAKEFRKWLKTRSLDLRTKGVAISDGRADDMVPQKLNADLSHLSPSLGRLQSVMQTMNAMYESTVRTAEEVHKNTQKTQELESKTYQLEDRLDEIDQWRHSNELKMGEQSFMTLAENTLIMCSSTKGKTPNAGAVSLLCFNAEYDKKGLLRPRSINVEGHDPVPGYVLTPKGVRAFIHEILPLIGFGRGRVEPNEYSRKRYGRTRGFNFIRLRQSECQS